MGQAEVMVTRPDCRRKEMAHVQDALKTNGYQQWMIKVPKPKQQQSITSTGTRPEISGGLPYMQGTSEALTLTHYPVMYINYKLHHFKLERFKLI